MSVSVSLASTKAASAEFTKGAPAASTKAASAEEIREG